MSSGRTAPFCWSGGEAHLGIPSGGIVPAACLPIQQGWQQTMAAWCDTERRKGDSSAALLPNNTLTDNHWITFKHFCLHIAENTFDYGFYSLGESRDTKCSPVVKGNHRQGHWHDQAAGTVSQPVLVTNQGNGMFLPLGGKECRNKERKDESKDYGW